MSTTITDIKSAIRELGLRGQPMIVHSSLRSFGWVDGGARAVIDGMLEEGCTVMVPSFTAMSFVAPPPGVRPGRNAISYDPYPAPQAGPEIPVYTPETNEIDRGLGTIPCTLMEYEGRVRGKHPIESFTAVGPMAHRLIDGQDPIRVFEPFDALAEVDGWVVLMGVGLTRTTLIHHAEQRAGRHPFIRWANGPDGEPFEAWLSGCSGGFGRLEEPLSHLWSSGSCLSAPGTPPTSETGGHNAGHDCQLISQRPVGREILVGESLWKVFPARDLLEQATQLMIDDPQITHCSSPDCIFCHDAIAGGPEV